MEHRKIEFVNFANPTYVATCVKNLYKLAKWHFQCASCYISSEKIDSYIAGYL